MQVKAFSVSGLVVGYPFGKLNNVEDVSFFFVSTELWSTFPLH